MTGTHARKSPRPATSSPSTLTHTGVGADVGNADCADLIVPTLMHALRSWRFRLATSAQSCWRWLLLRLALLLARRTLFPISATALEQTRWYLDGVSPWELCPTSHLNPPCLNSVRTDVRGPRILPTSPACNPVPPGRPRTTSAQSRGRHNGRSAMMLASVGGARRPPSVASLGRCAERYARHATGEAC
jgi:hypothetical protein